MENKKYSALVVTLLFLSFSFISFCISEAFGENEEIPEWLKRVEFSVEMESDKKPNFYFQTVQPLHQDSSKIHTVFIQPRMSINDSRNDFNLGVGYRNLSLKDWILGGNFFVDYDGLNEHGRLGIGLEALGQVVEARFNSYFKGLTERKAIISKSTSTTYQQVVDGMDLEFGVPLPYLPWMKIYGSGFWYDYKQFDDKYGWKSRLEARLNDGLKLEFYSWDDNKGEAQFGARIRCSFAFTSFSDIKNVFQFSEKPYPEKDLSEELLQPVERNFEIIVEEWKDTGGFVIEAGRS